MYFCHNSKLKCTREQQQVTECKNIIMKYINSSYILFNNTLYDNLNTQLNKANSEILSKDYDGALTTAFNILEYVIKTGLRASGINYEEIKQFNSN